MHAPGVLTYSYPVSAKVVLEGDTVTLADGATVTTWPNTGSSGTAQNAVATADPSPTLHKSVVNGHAAVSFTSNTLKIPSAPFTTAAIGLLGVVRYNSAASYPMLLVPDPGTYVIELRLQAALMLIEWLYGGPSVADSVALTVATWHIVEGTYQGGNLYAYRDGNLIGTAVAAPYTPTSYDVLVGNRVVGGSFPLVGDIAALVVTGALSDTDRQNIEGHFAWKYGLQGLLPANHPWKNAAP